MPICDEIIVENLLESPLKKHFYLGKNRMIFLKRRK